MTRQAARRRCCHATLLNTALLLQAPLTVQAALPLQAPLRLQASLPLQARLQCHKVLIEGG